MRLYLHLTENTEAVPFDYQHFLIGSLHKWMGKNNDKHDNVSLYSLSWLYKSTIVDNDLNFPKGAKWFISFYDTGLLKIVLNNLLKDPNVCCGMMVHDVQIVDTPSFSNEHRFVVSTPVLVRKFDGKGLKHILYNDDEAEELLTQTLKTKLERTDIKYDSVRVRFDNNYSKPKTKLVTIKGIKNKANLCPVIVSGNPDVVAFAWDVGIGHSTGSGFGALC